MPSFTDQLGKTIALEHIPRKIISLVPSQTELLSTLDLEDEVVGITKFCIHPASWFRTKTRIGGTKDLHLERVEALQPDLVIANKEENDREQIETIAARYPVWISDVHTLTDALDMIRTVGTLTGRSDKAQTLAAEIKQRFADLALSTGQSPTNLSLPTPPLRTAYFIWRDPWMAAGGDTFIHDMLHQCGFTNVFAHETRYPIVDLQTLAQSNCEAILLSSEPYPFKEKHLRELKELLPAISIHLVDGQLFSWYGSRLLHAPSYFVRLKAQMTKYP